MSETNMLILELIRQKKSLKEISQITNLSLKQVWQRIKQIKNYGYMFYTRYQSDGEIVFHPRHIISTPEDYQNKQNIYTYDTDDTFSALAISDLHIGNSKERLDLVNRLYEFCSQNDIHIILNTGDFIDGLFGRTPRLHENYQEQLYYVINKFPHDDSILNFILLGNHDISILDQENLDVAHFLENQRHDLIPIGYGNGTINVKNDSIGLIHSISGSANSRRLAPPVDCPIVFTGHSHKMKIDSQNCHVKCTLPSVSDLLFSENDLPGAVLMKASFNKGLFSYVTLKQLIFDGPQIRTINETTLRVRNKSSIEQVYGNIPTEKRNKLILKRD